MRAYRGERSHCVARRREVSRAHLLDTRGALQTRASGRAGALREASPPAALFALDWPQVSGAPFLREAARRPAGRQLPHGGAQRGTDSARLSDGRLFYCASRSYAHSVALTLIPSCPTVPLFAVAVSVPIESRCGSLLRQQCERVH